MATKKKKKPNLRKPHLLSSTRPPILQKPPSLSSRATRTLIRTHHTLQKQLTNALASNDTAQAASIQCQIEASGGLQKYQQASITGQSAERGGDSSKVLMEWLSPLLRTPSGTSTKPSGTSTLKMPINKKFKMLEVGALQVDNACSRSGVFDMERIDLHSQHPKILEQDFMQRSLPEVGRLEEEGFDIVSLSLVVNYVGDPVQRGDMLKRVGRFLRMGGDGTGWEREFSPGLFLVLPSPCVSNSRYLDEETLGEIMAALGFKMTRRKLSRKLVYYYWKWEGGIDGAKPSGKRKVRRGGGKNNFAIVLR